MMLASFVLREPIDLINARLAGKSNNRLSCEAAEEIYLHECRISLRR